METKVYISKSASLSKFVIIALLGLVIFFNVIIYWFTSSLVFSMWFIFGFIFYQSKSYLVFRYRRIWNSDLYIHYSEGKAVRVIPKDEIKRIKVFKSRLWPFYNYFLVKCGRIELKVGGFIYFLPLLPVLSKQDDIDRFEKDYLVRTNL